MNGRWIPLVLLLASTLCASGCFSTTHIYSQPSGAKVTLDGTRSLGQTPVQLTEQVWIWTKHNITVQADGYVPETRVIESTGINYGYAVVCVCTLGLLFPLGLLSEYPKQYVVQLTPGAPQPSSQASLNRTQKVSFR